MIDRVFKFIAQQSPEEIARQHLMLSKIESTRSLLTIFAYLVCAIFLPLWLCLVLAALDTVAEWLGTRLLDGLVPARDPWRYLLNHLCVILGEFSFALPAALIWQLDDPFGRAMTIGMIALTLLQLMSLRCIHLPFAVTGWLTVFVIGMAGNVVLWVRVQDWAGLALTSLVGIAIAIFALSILRANHDIHDTIARDRAAAQAADHAKSRFLARMSHELRTPLNAIIGMGSVEMLETANPETQERMATLVRSARGLGVILDDILDLAAAEEGRLTMRPQPLNLSAEVVWTVALFRPLAEAQGIEILADLDRSLPSLANFDGQRLRQCLSNILSNALKHTASGQIMVHVTTADGQAIINISDTGSGIDPALAARLFEPFQQGPNSKDGTGLGLSISRQIARAMGGDLTLLPQEKGARFRLVFVLEPAGTVVPAPAPVDVRALDLGKARVLVVDDVATNRLVVTAFLRFFNAQSIEASSGEAAIDLISAEAPALVLLDMHMPGMDGIETFRRICRMAEEQGQKRPIVVAMTADATDAHRIGYLGVGLDDYIAKPLGPELLAEVLARHLA
jgi:signal transduction histidine kinase